MGVRGSKLSRALSFQKLKRSRGTSSLVTPKGYIPVAVGVDEEMKRFMVRITALSNAEFVQLLRRSAEEYGFCSEGILRISYDANEFEEWMSRNSPKQMGKILRIQPTNT